MPNVYKFPPVGIAAYENTIDNPMSISTGIGGAVRGSQTRVNRTLYLAQVHGPGDGVGYVEALKQLLKGQLPLVQVDTLPAVWWGRTGSRGVLEENPVSWTAGGTAATWTAGGTAATWYQATPIESTAGVDVFNYIDVTGIPSGVTVHVGEAIQGGGDIAYVLRTVTSAGGTTRLWLTAAIPNGHISIGKNITRVFRITEPPRAMQGTGGFAYDFAMKEAFATDFVGGFTVLDPWT
tara:strand:- start:989 stop:1696 length:708 start_codon:yes stop_codon:yes gene_type:complete